MSTSTDAAPAPDTGARSDSFKEEIRSLKIKDPNAGRDTLMLRIGIIAMVLGVVVSIVAYFISHGTSNTLTQNDSLTIGMIGIALTVAGRSSLPALLARGLLPLLAGSVHLRAAKGSRLIDRSVVGSRTAGLR